jgi:hypothetical protein
MRNRVYRVARAHNLPAVAMAPNLVFKSGKQDTYELSRVWNGNEVDERQFPANQYGKTKQPTP